MLRYYTAYGLQIASELQLPETLTWFGRCPDVHIRLGQLSTELPNPYGTDRSSQEYHALACMTPGIDLVAMCRAFDGLTGLEPMCASSRYTEDMLHAGATDTI